MNCSRHLNVRISYAEIYEGRTRSFTIDYRVVTDCSHIAFAVAEREFIRLQRESGVGWIREIREIKIIEDSDVSEGARWIDVDEREALGR